MPAPLDPEVRASIEQAIRQGQTRNAIARAHHVSGSTVSKIGKTLEDQDGSPPFERSQTKRARVQRSDDLAARRVEFALLLADDWLALRERMWEKQTQVVVVPTKGGGATAELVQVPGSSADFKNYSTAIGILVDKVRVLTERSDSPEVEAASLIKSLVDDIRTRKTPPADPPAEPTPEAG